MKTRFIPLVVVVALAGCGTVPQPNTDAQRTSSTASGNQVSVTRYTERPLSEFQTEVMNAATKLSHACRYFRSLYGRWPADISEIKAKTVGIDFGVFLGKASVTPQADDTAVIAIFDGVNMRSTRAVPVAFTIPEEERTAAQKPGYKIRL